VHHPTLPANDLPGALITRWIPWIRLFNFNVKHVPGRLNGGPDGLFQRPQEEGEPEPEEEDDLEESIAAGLQGIRVERGTEQRSRGRASEQFVGLRLAEEYKERCKQISEFLGNLKRPEGKTMKQIQQISL